MAWTPEDERRYQELKKQVATLQAQETGAKHLATAQPKAAPFSAFRAGVGAVRDAIQGTVDTVYDLNTSASKIPLVGRLFENKLGKAIEEKGGAAQLKLPGLKGEENAGTAEKITRGIGSFVVPFIGWSKAFKVTQGATTMARLGRGWAASAATNFTNVEPLENNLAGFVKDTFNVDNKTLDYLASSEDDSALEQRVKSVVSNLPLDIGADVAFEGLSRAVKMYKTVRQGREVAQDLAETSIKVPRLQLKATRAAKQAAPVPGIGTAPSTLPTAANDGVLLDPKTLVDEPKAKPQAVKTTDTPSGPPIPPTMVTVPKEQVKPKAIASVDEFVAYARDTLKALPDDNPERISRLAKAITEDPENVFPKLGIDPAKLDPSVYADPEKLGQLHNALGDLIDDIAQRTGRTGIRVSNKETLRTAHLLSANPDVLAKLVDGTKGLAGKLTAARVITGHHAHTLLKDADEAIAEIGKGGSGAAYNRFLESLHRHSVLLGTLRGAGSEIGRALQSLQMTVAIKDSGRSLSEAAEAALERARTAAPKATKAAKDAVQAVSKEVDLSHPEVTRFLRELTVHRVDDAALEAIAARHGITTKEVSKQLGVNWKQVEKLREATRVYSDMFKDLQTDAGKLRLLHQLRGAEGDLRKLNRIADSRHSTWLERTDDILRESVGNLWSVGTAAKNMLSAAMVMSLRTAEQGLGALFNTALSPFSEQAAQAARIGYLRTWASIHGPLQAFGTAMRNTLDLIAEDGLTEFARIADTLGAESIAAKAQLKAITKDGKLTHNIIRAEGAFPPALYVSPETLNAITSQVEQYPIGRIGQMGVEWMLKTLATTANVAGSVTRLGTTLFIKAPDQFAGTLAARAGAHTAALTKAADEAAELGLRGDDLLDYIRFRGFEIADGIDGVADDAFESGQKEALTREGEDYARWVMFQDELETGLARNMANVVNNVPIFGTLFAPIVKTPLRILERTTLDHLGVRETAAILGYKNQIREAWLAGDAAVRGEIAGRFVLSLSVLAAAYELAGDRVVVGNDGGYKSTSRLDRPSYSMKIGADIVDFSWMDPVGTMLGLAADIREATEAIAHREDADALETAHAVMEASIWSIFRNILNKTWMTSTKQLVDIANESDAERAMEKLKKMTASTATRFVPGSGVQRQVEKWDDGIVREARGFNEGLIRSSVGADGLPVKRDSILGRPIEMLSGDRLFGLKQGPESTDPLIRELEALHFELPTIPGKLKGVTLTSSQYSRLLELRGQVVVDESGLTLDQKLQEVIKDPEYQDLGPNARVEVLREAMRGYTRLANERLIAEDPKLSSAILRETVWKEYRAQDRTKAEARQEAARRASEAGFLEYIAD